MKAALFLMFLSLTVTSAFAQSKKDVLPENNFCSPIIDSKRYLTNDFHSNYPRRVKFECTYQCKANGKMQTIMAVSDVTIHSMDDDATNVVCQGVVVKKVSWGYDFDKVVPFYAYMTSMPEIKAWAFDNISLNPKINSLEVANLQKLKQDLYQVAASFIMAGNNGGAATAHFIEAGKRLSAIGDQLPGKTTLLDETIKQIVVNRGAGKLGNTADSLVNTVISSAAGWRIPSHQF
nr:hypothetical protein BHI3_09970 [Bacteriovorax sp. HI3]